MRSSFWYFKSEFNPVDQELREIHTTWLEQKEKEMQRDAGEIEECMGEEEGGTMVGAPVEVETPTAFIPRELPTPTIDTDIPPLTPQDVKPPSALHGVDASSETFVNIPTTTVSSPTLSISTISDLTPTEFGEDIEQSEGGAATRHATFYFEDGNVEIVCGDTVFRVHSTTISFSSSKLRDMLSPSILLDAPMPEGCPRIVFADSAEDFAMLLKMIYTLGYVPPPEVVRD